MKTHTRLLAAALAAVISALFGIGGAAADRIKVAAVYTQPGAAEVGSRGCMRRSSMPGGAARSTMPSRRRSRTPTMFGSFATLPGAASILSWARHSTSGRRLAR